MADLFKALEYTLRWEGGYSNDPVDHGGATNYGITQQTLNQFNRKYPSLGLPDSVKSLTVKHVECVYRKEYWRYDTIESQRVATKLFDMGVNFGPQKAVKMLQAILGVTEDGVFGPNTLKEANAADEANLLLDLVDSCVSRYKAIIAKDPEQEKFRKGWMRRAKSLPVDQ